MIKVSPIIQLTGSNANLQELNNIDQSRSIGEIYLKKPERNKVNASQAIKNIENSRHKNIRERRERLAYLEMEERKQMREMYFKLTNEEGK
jgi:hypothetical protein